MAYRLLLAMAAIAIAAAPAGAVSTFTNGVATIDPATGAYTFTTNYAATAGSELAGTTGTIAFTFLSANAARTSYSFSYTVDNTSTSPSLSSRLLAFGFDTTGTPTSVTTGAGNRFNAQVGSNGNFNGLGSRDVCFYAGPNCNGGANDGVTVSEALVSGTFTLNYSSAVNSLVLNNFVARWNATGANANGSNAGGLVTNAVPEPATWGMMLIGFGLVGTAIRRRRATRMVLT